MHTHPWCGLRFPQTMKGLLGLNFAYQPAPCLHAQPKAAGPGGSPDARECVDNFADGEVSTSAGRVRGGWGRRWGEPRTWLSHWVEVDIRRGQALQQVPHLQPAAPEEAVGVNAMVAKRAVLQKWPRAFWNMPMGE